MGKRAVKKEPTAVETPKVTSERISLGQLLSETSPVKQDFGFWLIGNTPLISHAWSQKAKLEMLRKQTGATRSAIEKRDPEQDFLDSLYEMGDVRGEKFYGFPVTAIKKAIWSCAHKDKGIARTDVQAALWLDAEIVRVRPALAGAVCDMPLVRIWGAKAEMREDMVRIGSGLRKTANLAYRAQFFPWAIYVSGHVEVDSLAPHALQFLVKRSGDSVGIGDWRNEKGGYFGAYHLGKADEEKAWDRFKAGKGPVPISADYKQAAE